MVQINWTARATSDLKNIYDFIAADSNQFRIVYKIINENEVDVITIHYTAKEKLKL